MSVSFELNSNLIVFQFSSRTLARYLNYISGCNNRYFASTSILYFQLDCDGSSSPVKFAFQSVPWHQKILSNVDSFLLKRNHELAGLELTLDQFLETRVEGIFSHKNLTTRLELKPATFGMAV